MRALDAAYPVAFTLAGVGPSAVHSGKPSAPGMLRTWLQRGPHWLRRSSLYRGGPSRRFHSASTSTSRRVSWCFRAARERLSPPRKFSTLTAKSGRSPPLRSVQRSLPLNEADPRKPIAVMRALEHEPADDALQMQRRSVRAQRFQFGALRSVAHDLQTHIGDGATDPRHCLDQTVEAFSLGEPSNHDHRLRPRGCRTRRSQSPPLGSSPTSPN